MQFFKFGNYKVTSGPEKRRKKIGILSTGKKQNKKVVWRSKSDGTQA